MRLSYPNREAAPFCPERMQRPSPQESFSRCYIKPCRIIWKSESDKASVQNAEFLVDGNISQVYVEDTAFCTLKNRGEPAGLLLDFGTELHGAVQILTRYGSKGVATRLRVRFGESAMEAMSELKQQGSSNDHAVRDQTITISQLGSVVIGNTGFRFARIDLLNEDTFLEILCVRAVYIFRNLKYKGSFQCSDELLERIWITGARTAHLNLQDYLWDGIKRDRLVWVGDMYPEIATLQTVFGNLETVRKTLDFARDITPSPKWMNGSISYSMWWIMIQARLYLYGGSLRYLRQQKDYLIELMGRLRKLAEPQSTLEHGRMFVDWSTARNDPAKECIFYALLGITLRKGALLCGRLGAAREAEEALRSAENLKNRKYDPAGSKQAAAMLVVAGLRNPVAFNREMLAPGEGKGISAFLGYFVLRARAMAGDYEGCLNIIRSYWGGMISLGATTFWEEFDVDWLKNAGRIDELVPKEKVDVHGCTGNFCYTGYRKSLCHGWASGPTSWLTEFVLGIHPLEPGCSKILVEPHLGGLSWASGNFPTPKGIVRVRHVLKPDGTVRSEIIVPKGVTVLQKG